MKLNPDLTPMRTLFGHVTDSIWADYRAHPENAVWSPNKAAASNYY